MSCKSLLNVLCNQAMVSYGFEGKDVVVRECERTSRYAIGEIELEVEGMSKTFRVEIKEVPVLKDLAS